MFPISRVVAKMSSGSGWPVIVGCTAGTDVEALVDVSEGCVVGCAVGWLAGRVVREVARPADASVEVGAFFLFVEKLRSASLLEVGVETGASPLRVLYL